MSESSKPSPSSSVVHEQSESPSDTVGLSRLSLRGGGRGYSLTTWYRDLDPPDAIELSNFEDLARRRATETAPQSSADRRQAKLQDFLDGSDMKFSRSIQFNAVPDWSSHYIAYSNLKKL